MTKRQTIVRAALIGLVVVLLTIVVDGILVRAGLTWLAWVVDVAAVLGLVLGAWGMFGASSPLFGGVVDGSRIRRPVAALTFDDGPSPDTTPRILDALRREGVRATFFVLGKHAERHPELVERIVREGHELGNHGYDHRILAFAGPAEVHRQLHRTERILKQAGGPPPAWPCAVGVRRLQLWPDRSHQAQPPPAAGLARLQPGARARRTACLRWRCRQQ